MTYTTDQIANARIIFDFWFAKTKRDDIAASWVADADREDSLKPMLVGDKVHGVGTAFGIAQDHMPRVRSILAGAHVDMRTASVADQCRGIYWEVSKGAYKAILPALLATKTLWGINAILISRFEQSGDQSRDLAEQLPKAEHWLATFGGH